MNKVLVIGGSHGIGAGIVETLSQNRYDVTFTYRSRQEDAFALEERMKKNHFHVKALYGDFGNEASISEFVANIEDIDVLVINAAINHKASFLSYSSQELTSIMANNLTMPFLFAQKFAQKWINNNRKGKIINITSIRGNTPQIGRLGYCCSKAALNMMTRCAAYELASYGINVNAIAVGLTGLGMNEHLATNPSPKWLERIEQIPMGRTGEGCDIGNAVLFLASPNSDWITGEILNVDGGHQLVTF